MEDIHAVAIKNPKPDWWNLPSNTVKNSTNGAFDDCNNIGVVVRNNSHYSIREKNFMDSRQYCVIWEHCVVRIVGRHNLQTIGLTENTAGRSCIGDEESRKYILFAYTTRNRVFQS